MLFRRNGFLLPLMAIAFAIFAFNESSYAQFGVSISGPSVTTMPAPTGQFSVTAEVSGNASQLTKIVFYRNDVPYKSFTGSSTSQTLQENELGQDTYTYRARAYDSQGAWADSPDFKLTVETRYVFVMGTGLLQTPPPNAPSNPPSTTGPNRNYNHTQEVQNAVNYLRDIGGGTLVFPCSGGPGGDLSIYNIGGTVTVPSNVTLQGESAEEGIYNSRCRIYWNDNVQLPDTGCYERSRESLQGKAVFKVEGTKARVRFRDLWMVSRTVGRDCGNIGEPTQIQADDTTAILLDAQSGGNISDVIFENVSMTAFTYGIKAVGNSISDVKMRGVRPYANYRQLYIYAAYAYDWDVQNFNLSGMLAGQGAVEIKNAGAPVATPDEKKKLKFLQLNCNGNGFAPYEERPEFCVSIEKHGGLYFKQLHGEGIQKSLIVHDMGTHINSEPIILEHSAAVGEFLDDSMKLYLIGNSVFAAPAPDASQQQNHPDIARLEFFGAGLQPTVVDCGDVHWDRTDINGGTANWTDWQMLYTHSERNRNSFFLRGGNYSYVKPHTPCPTGINEVGGEHFNTGVLPVDYLPPLPNANTFGPCSDAGSCTVALQSLLDSNPNRGTVYINGTVIVNQTITIPSGRQLVGRTGTEPELVLTDPPCDLICYIPESLLRINVEVATRTSGITIRNLKIKRMNSSRVSTGLAIIGGNSSNAGTSSDMHFSGLVIEGFDKGLEVARFDAGPTIATGHPMVDGLSWKNITFVNNNTAAYIHSSNLSNWNIMNLSMESNTENADGWYQITSGTSMQNVACRGSAGNGQNIAAKNMEHCIELISAGIYLSGLKQTQYVTNALTVGQNLVLGYQFPYESVEFANLVLRNNDFRPASSAPSRLNFEGNAFVTSMNNKYQNFNVGASSDAKYSRVTYCGDNLTGSAAFPGLETRHPNLYVGVPTQTRVECSARPIPWDDAVHWGAEKKDPPLTGYYFEDQPLVGNFFDDVREDYVIYREATSSSAGQFRIKQAGASGTQPIIENWGAPGDKPLIGRFFPGERSQIVVWRPSTGEWWVKDPDTAATNVWGWGSSGDIPFTGNFINESGGSITGDMDEIAVYRPSTQTIWILNARSGAWFQFPRNADYGSQIQVGDFRGLGYDQIAQYKDGVWTILDARTNTTGTASLDAPQAGDIPVAGKYFSGACTQIAVWRPLEQKFFVQDPPFTNCGTRKESLIWGSNNDFGAGIFAAEKFDIPLAIRINTTNGPLDRPASYRPTKGIFTEGIANGQWWVHDTFGL